jgi:hypothetical protein
MNDKDYARLKAIATDLNIPNGRWVLAGSGSMVMHGIDRRMRDVDIFCATQTWFSLMSRAIGETLSGEHKWSVFATDPDDPQKRCDPPYLYRTMHDIEVNVFSGWRRRGVGDIDVAFWIHNAVMVDGIPCVNLQFILDWKLEVGRDKDVADIPLLQEYLERQHA